MRIGFVNNMPDSAFEETFRQFSALLGGDSFSGDVELACYYLPTVPRGATVLEAASVRYEHITELYGNRPDALVITGTEPRSGDLTAEPYWEELAGLLLWAEGEVPSVLLSCLASHAALLALDGIRRVRLPAKRSGVFEQLVDRTHPLSTDMARTVAFPHSRLNDVPAEALVDRRYRMMISSERTGWTVATRETSGRLLVMFQGHPEYGPTTLLKEYRRDVRRFLSGVYDSFPALPVDYLDGPGVELLEAYRARCEGGSDEEFPFQAAASQIRDRWTPVSRRLFANWVADARQRSALVPY